MYAHIQGEVTDILIDRAVVEAAGVGYELYCSAFTLQQLRAGSRAKLLTHLHLSEGVMVLYGFWEEAERIMFRRLITVTRVGPKLALAALSILRPADIAAAIVTENADVLARVPGLGKKTAQRLLLELKEKVDTQEMLGEGLPGALAADGQDAQKSIRVEATAALVGLGYDGASAQRAVLAVEQAESIEELLTKALRLLAKQ